MQIELNIADVLQAAIMLEERGTRFYSDAAELASGNERKLLEQLAGMELGHAKMFAGILAAYRAASGARETEQSEESSTYLQALTSDRIISTECQIEKDDTYPEILEKAMLVEKNSVFFYSSVKYCLLTGMPAGDIDRLIGEEIDHFRALNDALVTWRKLHS